MTSNPKRPWFRLHLLTAVLMMMVAGVVLWFRVGRYLGCAEAHSEWVEQDGLAVRLVIDNLSLTTESPAVLKLVLKNVSDKPFRVYKTSNGLQTIRIRLLDGELPLQVMVIPDSEPRESQFSDFEILTPTASLQQIYHLSIDDEDWIRAETYSYRYSGAFHGRTFSAEIHFFGGPTPLDREGNPDKRLAEAPLWESSLTTAPVQFIIDSPWTAKRVMAVIACVCGAALITSLVSESILRRREARRP